MVIEDNAYAVTKRIIAAFKTANAALMQAGADMIQSLWDGMVSKVEALMEWVKTIPQRIKASIGNIDLGGSIRSMIGLGGGGEIDGARASGGPVRAGGTYLVGEKGPELFNPGRSGVVSPHEAYRAASAASTPGAASGRGDVYLSVNPVMHVTAAGDVESIARRVMTLIGEEVKWVVEGLQSDGPYN